jgi:hypothetical protein
MNFHSTVIFFFKEKYHFEKRKKREVEKLRMQYQHLLLIALHTTARRQDTELKARQ